MDQTANQTQNFYLKKICTLQFLVPISIVSFLVSYFSVSPLYSSIFPLFTHALDRKCMFLLCNGILAFLANNMKLNTSALNYAGFMKRFDDEHLPQMVDFQENAASTEYVDRTPFDAAVSEEKVIHEVIVQQEQHINGDEEGENEMVRLEIEEWEEDEDENEEEIEENAGVDDAPSVSDMRVSTEDLNKKFDEFIRKMKEEIRIEAMQQYVIVV